MSPDLDRKLASYLLEDVPKLRAAVESLSHGMTTLNQNFAIYVERTDARFVAANRHLESLQASVDDLENTGKVELQERVRETEAEKTKAKDRRNALAFQIVGGSVLLVLGALASYTWHKLTPPANATPTTSTTNTASTK